MLIAIDNGHGISTPGKRTPMMADGKVIKEWEFNYPTAKKLEEILKYNGFTTLMVSDTEQDTPLSVRVKKANDAKADLFISIHFNAYQGIWGSHGGIETFHYPNSTTGKRLADLIQEELIRETGLRNRGVKTADFQVLRGTRMPSALVECGFMDNLDEAKLMLDEVYQLKCATAIAKGICRYFNIEYKEKSKNPPSKWAEDDWQWGIKNGITDGTDPQGIPTREQVVAMIRRSRNL